MLCRHYKLRFIRNIHGDEINEYNGKRAIWECVECKKQIFTDQPYIKSSGYIYATEAYKSK